MAKQKPLKPDVATKPNNRADELMRSDCRDAVQYLIDHTSANREGIRRYIARDLMLSVEAQCRVLGVRLIDTPLSRVPEQREKV